MDAPEKASENAVEKILKEAMDPDEEVLARLHYRKEAWTATYNVAAIPTIYDYYFFATNKRLLGVFVDKFPELVELPYSKIEDFDLIEEYNIDKSLFIVIIGIFWFYLLLIAFLPPVFSVPAILTGSLLTYVVFKLRKKRRYYQIKGSLKRWEKNFWRIPAEEYAEDFVKIIRRMAGV
jgi:hypothetical protein